MPDNLTRFHHSHYAILSLFTDEFQQQLCFGRNVRINTQWIQAGCHAWCCRVTQRFIHKHQFDLKVVECPCARLAFVITYIIISDERSLLYQHLLSSLPPNETKNASCLMKNLTVWVLSWRRPYLQMKTTRHAGFRAVTIETITY